MSGITANEKAIVFSDIHDLATGGPGDLLFADFGRGAAREYGQE